MGISDGSVVGSEMGNSVLGDADGRGIVGEALGNRVEGELVVGKFGGAGLEVTGKTVLGA